MFGRDLLDHGGPAALGMADAKIVLTVPGGRADLSRKDAQWLSEHLPPAALLRNQLRTAAEQDIEGAHIDIIEISYAERDQSAGDP